GNRVQHFGAQIFFLVRDVDLLGAICDGAHGIRGFICVSAVFSHDGAFIGIMFCHWRTPVLALTKKDRPEDDHKIRCYFRKL
ncbi:MAG: hypothetical protein QF832_01725, partial [SAR324 cluster bacterium]|nr:hypothetical protein [SAR324 cluster bacterium]